MQIRIATKEDVEKIGPELKRSWLTHVDNEPDFINREAIEKTDLIKYFEDCFNESGKSVFFVAEENGEIAGFTKINIQPLQSFFNQTSVIYIDDIYTMDNFRKSGVAKFLIQEVEKFAKEKGIGWLKARVYFFNEPAQKTFQSSKFKNLYSEYFKIIE